MTSLSAFALITLNGVQDEEITNNFLMTYGTDYLAEQMVSQQKRSFNVDDYQIEIKYFEVEPAFIEMLGSYVINGLLYCGSYDLTMVSPYDVTHLFGKDNVDFYHNNELIANEVVEEIYQEAEIIVTKAEIVDNRVKCSIYFDSSEEEEKNVA